MELRNCPECGKLFVYVRRNLCPDCLKKDEENYEKVKTYLSKNPKATIDEISDATQVPAKNVLEYLKEGRLMLSPGNVNIILNCEICGTPILYGRVCEECSKKLKSGFVSQNEPIPTKEDMTGKIHITKLIKYKKETK